MAEGRQVPSGDQSWGSSGRSLQGPGRGLHCRLSRGPRTINPKALAPPGPPRKQGLWFQPTLLAGAKERLGQVPGLRLPLGLRPQASCPRPPEGPAGILQELLPDSLWPESGLRGGPG